MELESMQAALSYAAGKLGVRSLNEHQQAAVKAVVGGKDVFVCLPTGYGKPLCFQSLPFVRDYLSEPDSPVDRHIAIVVEPTASIMREQVSKLTMKGVSAAFINHDQKDVTVKKAVVEGNIKVVYISPESLTIPRFRDMLLSKSYKDNLCVFAIDEVHCMLTWVNFRHKFATLNEVRAVLACPVMALTATCTSQARDTISMQLNMENAVDVSTGGDRPNIYLSTIQMPTQMEKWRAYLDEDIAMVHTLGVSVERKVFFCRSIEKACKLYEYYEEALGTVAYFDPEGKRVPANRIIAMFHSVSAGSVKDAVGDALSNPNGVVRRVFATQSLSMGIDCPNFRYVVHWEVPRTLEAYYQEVGRAGRDGMPARAILLYHSGHLRDTFCSTAVQEFCCNTTTECLRFKVMKYFSVDYDKTRSQGHCCSVCDVLQV